AIILLPVSNGLFSSYGMTGAVAVLYGLHLTAIATINVLLWRLATGPGLNPDLAAALFPLAMFVPGTVLAAIDPAYAVYCWLLGFGGLVVNRLMSRNADAPTSAPPPEQR